MLRSIFHVHNCYCSSFVILRSGRGQFDKVEGRFGYRGYTVVGDFDRDKLVGDIAIFRPSQET